MRTVSLSGFQPGTAALALISEAHALLYPDEDIFLDEWQAATERVRLQARALWTAGTSGDEVECLRLLSLLMAGAAVPVFSRAERRKLCAAARACLETQPLSLLTIRLRLYLYGETYDESLYREAARWLAGRLQADGALTEEEQEVCDTLELLRGGALPEE